MDLKMYKSFKKVKKTILSCITEEHIKGCYKLLNNYNKMFSNYDDFYENYNVLIRYLFIKENQVKV